MVRSEDTVETEGQSATPARTQVGTELEGHSPPAPKRRRGRPRKDPNATTPQRKARPTTPLDPDAQPHNAFNAWRRSDRSTSELIGLARGIAADGVISASEFSLLVDWLESNPDTLYCYPGNILLKRVERILSDGRIDPEELDDLAELLKHLTGEGRPVRGANASTTLPLDPTPPPILFAGQRFVFTGKFALGPRTLCEEAITARGGETYYSMTRRINYLVIGTIGSRDWYHTSHGRKIEEAVRLRDQGYPVAIISEDHWAVALG